MLLVCDQAAVIVTANYQSRLRLIRHDLGEQHILQSFAGLSDHK